MKEQPRLTFRQAAHTAGAASVKPKDYEPGGEIEAPSAYGAWAAARGSETPLMVGDLLEDPAGNLRICKYVGFEEARWVLPEVKSGIELLPAAIGSPVPASLARA